MSRCASTWTTVTGPWRRDSARSTGSDGVVAADDERDRAGREHLVDRGLDQLAHGVGVKRGKGHIAPVEHVDRTEHVEAVAGVIRLHERATRRSS